MSINITFKELSALSALEEYTPDSLIAKDLTLTPNKHKYKKFSIENIIHLLRGTHKHTSVAKKIIALLSSENVQKYLKENQEQATKIKSNIELVSAKFSKKGNNKLDRTTELFAQIIESSEDESPNIAPATIDKIRHKLQLPFSLTQKARSDLMLIIGKAFPEMKIISSLGDGGYSSAYKFQFQQGSDTRTKVLKLSPWSTVVNSPKSYKLGKDESGEIRVGGEWLSLLKYNKYVAKTTHALVYDVKKEKFLIIKAPDFRNIYQNLAKVENGQYNLVGTVMNYVDNAEEIPYDQKFTNSRIKKVLEQIILAIASMHLNDVMHRDLKFENILITPEDKVKIIDFGLSRNFQKGHARKYSRTGNQLTLPPKLAANYMLTNELVEYSEKRDVYGAAILIYQMATGHIPFHNSRYKASQIYLHNERKGLELEPSLDEIIDPELVDLICKMGAYEEEDRPDINEVLDHPFFARPPSIEKIYEFLDCTSFSDTDEITSSISEFIDDNDVIVYLNHYETVQLAFLEKIQELNELHSPDTNSIEDLVTQKLSNF